MAQKAVVDVIPCYSTSANLPTDPVADGILLAFIESMNDGSPTPGSTDRRLVQFVGGSVNQSNLPSGWLLVT